MCFDHSSVWHIKTPIQNSYIFPYANSTFRSNRSVQEAAGFLRDKTIVLIGDSVTRYQFLYLLRYLHSGKWTDTWGQQLYFEHGYNSWENFFAAISSVFGCQLIIDSIRDGTHPQGHENHYYYHNDLNLTLSFHFWSSETIITTMPFPVREDFAYLCRHFTAGDPRPAIYPRNHTISAGGLTAWEKVSHRGIEQFLTQMIAPRAPDMLIINHGLWDMAPEYGGGDPMKLPPVLLKSFIKTTLSTAQIAVWKVTSATRNGNTSHESIELLEQMHNHGIKIFHTYNLTWEMTRNKMMKSAMWDNLHFMSFVYRELNIALLEHMQTWFGERSQQDHHHDQHHQYSHTIQSNSDKQRRRRRKRKRKRK